MSFSPFHISALTSHCKTLDIWLAVHMIMLIITVCQLSLIEDICLLLGITAIFVISKQCIFCVDSK